MEKAKAFIESGDGIPLSFAVAEFTDKYVREKLDPKERLKFIRTNTMITSLDDELAGGCREN